ncbi:MAG: hypothetical protein ACREWJ_02650, partial [Rhodoferax sp.]
MRHLTRELIAAALLGGCVVGHAATTTMAATQEIYTCTDGKGNVLTADRPIASFMDLKQNVLGPFCTLLCRIG